MSDRTCACNEPDMLVSCVCDVTERDSLIDVNIETAVSRMQTVVELGRVIRDRHTLPTKACHHISQPFDAHCCHIGTAPVPDRVKSSFVIFDTRAL